MFVGLALVTLGCTLRVSCEVVAYQGYAAWAWSVLPIFRAVRTGRTYRVRHQYCRDIYSRACPFAETDHDRGCARQDFLKRTRH